MLRVLVLGLFVSVVPLAFGNIVISEWMYNGSGIGSTGEFVEFTNTGPNSVNMTGWSFDDGSRVPGTISLSAFGVVAPGQSVILTDVTSSEFASIWELSGVSIIGGNTANLGRNDEINLFDNTGALVDRLTYGDETFPGTLRTLRRSCNIPATDYAYAAAHTSWLLAVDDDAYGSHSSARGEVGSPGRTVGFAHSDFDHDGDVDMADFNVFSGCLTGPSVWYEWPPFGGSLNPGAGGRIAADLDQDGDVDMADFTLFQPCYSGDGNPADLTCGQSAAPPVVTEIVLNGDSITVHGGGVTVNGSKATITSQGQYSITGTLDDGQIVVNTADPGVVAITLAGVNITNSTNACLYVMSAAHTALVLADQCANQLTDPSTYIYEDPNATEPNAALFSADPLTISGSGALTVYGNYNDAIASKDELVIAGGTIHATAVDDGIRGKDYLAIDDGDVTATAGGDGLKSDHSEDPALGFIVIEDGSIHITSAGDAITAETDVAITGGDFTIVSGGGHTVTIPADASAKGIKGLARVVIGGGTLNLDCADDGVHSNNAVTVSAGTLTIACNSSVTASYGDAIHAENALDVTGGTITITTCYEGLEGSDIAISDGSIQITSSDDAIDSATTVAITGGDFTILPGGGHTVTIPSTRSAKGIKGLTSVVIGGGTFNLDCADDGVHSDNAVTVSGGTLTIATNSSTSASYGDGVHAENALHITGGTITVTTSYEGIECKDITIDNGTIRVHASDDGINAAGGSGTNNYLHINGGYVAVYAAGDGIDVNGSITMTGGTVIVHGPTADNNAAIDYDVSFNISGGVLVAAGSAGMAQAPSSSSTQRSVKITYTQAKAAGTLAHLELTATPHTDILTFAPSKQYRSLVFSAPTLTQGTSFDLYRAGSSTGTATDGLYQGGTYTPGTKTNTFTTNNIVTNVSAP